MKRLKQEGGIIITNVTNIEKEMLIKRLMNHDSETNIHSERVAQMAYKFGTYLGYDEKRLQNLYDAARFHDVGKLFVDSKILTKKGGLDDSEFAQILQHPIHSESILRDMGFPSEVLEAVRGHHENYNGTGYPDKLDYRQINAHAAIIRIIDSYDSIINVRPYSAAEGKEEAINEILSLKGTMYNPYLADRFSDYMFSNELNVNN